MDITPRIISRDDRVRIIHIKSGWVCNRLVQTYWELRGYQVFGLLY